MSESETLVQSRENTPSNVQQSRKLGRRALFTGIVALAVPAVALELERQIQGGVAAQTSTEATATVGTPASGASPVAITGTPVPSANPVVTPALGQLTLVEDQRPTYPGLPRPGGELRLPLGAGENSNFSPPSFRQDFQIMASYLDPLIWIDEVTMDPLPWLAESWKWSQGGTRLSLKLRTDVLWHNGDKFTAEDVVFSFIAYRDDFDSAVRNIFSPLLSVEASDDYTVVAILSNPDGNFIRNACSQFMMQESHFRRHWNSRDVGQRTLSDFNWSKSTPIGTGPWKVAKREKNEISFSRNEDYWNEAPYTESLTLNVIEDPSERIRQWISGDVDVIWPFSPGDLPSVTGSPGTLYAADTASVMFAAFNFNNPNRIDPFLFKDINLRRALSLAIDRNRYAREVFAGFTVPDAAGTIAQPWAHESTTSNPPRDLDAARKLLVDGGYRDLNGDGILESPSGETLKLRLIVRNTARPDLIALLKSIVADLAEVGIELNVRELSPTRFDGEWIDTHNFDLIAYAYNLYPTFTDFDLYGTDWDIRTNIQGWNPGGYSNQEVDQAIRAALIEPNSDRQAALLRKLQRVANEDLFALWFGFPRDLVLVRPGVQGFQPNKQWQTWGTARLWKESN